MGKNARLFREMRDRDFLTGPTLTVQDLENLFNCADDENAEEDNVNNSDDDSTKNNDEDEVLTNDNKADS